MGLPYPRLEYLAQSLLETQRWVALEDLVDGMNLTEEWGESNLQLDRVCNLEYSQLKNQKIRASIPETPFSELMEMIEMSEPLRPIWKEILQTKERRMGPELPKGHYLTRFYPVDAQDPRLEKRTMY
jgi:hypothetical protein